jgi:rSAM/selenodomain-associated transferase 1
MPQPALMIFAKQPLPGQTKTRLLPDYTPEQAAAIAEVLIRETVGLAVSTWPGEIYLCGAPDTDHPLFAALARDFRLRLLDQRGADLGARMLEALRFGIERHGAAAVLGSDVPHCRWDVLDEANAHLAQGRSVLGPTEDGGYYLVGLQQPHEALFTRMAWGGPTVLNDTLARAAAIGLEFEMLSPLRDIDTAADLWLIGRTYEPLMRFL